ncbi:MAG: hypothetical protein ABIA74_06155 [bacterium]
MKQSFIKYLFLIFAISAFSLNAKNFKDPSKKLITDVKKGFLNKRFNFDALEKSLEDCIKNSASDTVQGDVSFFNLIAWLTIHEILEEKIGDNINDFETCIEIATHVYNVALEITKDENLDESFFYSKSLILEIQNVAQEICDKAEEFKILYKIITEIENIETNPSFIIKLLLGTKNLCSAVLDKTKDLGTATFGKSKNFAYFIGNILKEFPPASQEYLEAIHGQKIEIDEDEERNPEKIIYKENTEPKEVSSGFFSKLPVITFESLKKGITNGTIKLIKPLKILKPTKRKCAIGTIVVGGVILTVFVVYSQVS